MRFRLKSLNAAKKSFEARVTLLSRYFFPPKNGLPRIPGYPLIHMPLVCKIKVFFGNDSGKGSKKMKRGRDCADML